MWWFLLCHYHRCLTLEDFHCPQQKPRSNSFVPSHQRVELLIYVSVPLELPILGIFYK